METSSALTASSQTISFGSRAIVQYKFAFGTKFMESAWSYRGLSRRTMVLELWGEALFTEFFVDLKGFSNYFTNCEPRVERASGSWKIIWKFLLSFFKFLLLGEDIDPIEEYSPTWQAWFRFLYQGYFPQPLSPTMPRTWPWSTLKLTL